MLLLWGLPNRPAAADLIGHWPAQIPNFLAPHLSEGLRAAAHSGSGFLLWVSSFCNLGGGSASSQQASLERMMMFIALRPLLVALCGHKHSFLPLVPVWWDLVHFLPTIKGPLNFGAKDHWVFPQDAP